MTAADCIAVSFISVTRPGLPGATGPSATVIGVKPVACVERPSAWERFPQAPAPFAFAELWTSIFFGNASSVRGAVISSTPLLYSAVSLELATPSGSAITRSNLP